MLESLDKHLPNPLSGLITINEKSNELTVYPGLEFIPSSIFEICAHLCVIDEAKAIILSHGFLRRSLEKLIINYKDFSNYMNTIIFTKQTIDRTNISYRNVVSTLKLVNSICNYNNYKYGNSNDVIYHAIYNIVPICKHILAITNHSINPIIRTRKDRTNEFDRSARLDSRNLNNNLIDSYVSRSDQLIDLVVNVLSNLSFDILKFYESNYVTCISNNILIDSIYQTNLLTYDLLDLILNELINYIDSYKQSTIEKYLTILTHISQSYRLPHIIEKLSNYRPILIKIGRIFPSIHSLVINVNWEITKNTLGSGKQYVHKQKSLNDKIIDEYVNITTSNPSTPLKKLEKQLDLFIDNELDKSIISPVDSKLDYTDEMNEDDDSLLSNAHTHLHSAGNYCSCGISTCGSLRNRIVSSIPQLAINQANQSSNYECEISKLSARSKKLQDLIEYRKQANLIKPKTSIDFNDYKTIRYGLSSSPSKLNGNKQLTIQVYKHVDRSLTTRAKTEPIHSNKRKNIKKKLKNQLVENITIPLIDIDECPDLLRTKPPTILPPISNTTSDNIVKNSPSNKIVKSIQWKDNVI